MGRQGNRLRARRVVDTRLKMGCCGWEQAEQGTTDGRETGPADRPDDSDKGKQDRQTKAANRRRSGKQKRTAEARRVGRQAGRVLSLPEREETRARQEFGLQPA